MINNQPLISIIIVTWNSVKYLPALFNSIDIQSMKNFDVIVVDNGSSDNSAQWIVQNRPDARLIMNSNNLGFAAANNQGIRLSESPYVLLCNTDIVMSADLIETLYNIIKSDQSVASVGGKLLKSGADLNNPSNSDIIDSTGIAIYRNRRAVDRGENMRNAKIYDESCEVFGISGALVMYRKSALDLVAYQGEYFDESFFSYKEDVDLAWRLRLAGFTAYYIATAVAIHERGAAMITNLTDRGTIRNRISKSKRVNFLSYRNHLYLLLKYEGINSVLFNPSLIWYEMKKFFYLLIKEPSNLNSIVSICRSIPEIRKKRENISSITRVSKKELNKWFQ